MDPDGRAEGTESFSCINRVLTKNPMTATMNYKEGTRPVGQIKFSENKDRTNHRFADVSHFRGVPAWLQSLTKYTGQW
jgi:hypothetical protein